MVLRLVTMLLICAILWGCSTPDESIGGMSLGETVVLLLNDRPKEALAQCDKILLENPTDYRAVLLRGEICEALKDEGGAIRAYKRAQELRPADLQPDFCLRRLQKKIVERDQFGAEENQVGATLNVALQSFVEPKPTEADTTFSHDFEYSDDPEDIPDARLNGNDKSYRTEQSPVATRHLPTPIPENHVFARLTQAIAEGQRLDQIDDLEGRCPPPHRNIDREQTPSDEAGLVQITRFDLGLGHTIDPAVFVPRARPTGHHSAMTSRRTNRALVAGPALTLQLGRATRMTSAGHAVDCCQPSRASFLAGGSYASFRSHR